jgi:uncharacterized YigZ family protein
MKYKTVEDIADVIIKEKSSKFIGFAFFIQHEADIKNKIEAVKLKYSKATHYCYAYRLGNKKDSFRAFDDGEPNGTAGRTILNQIDSFGLTNVLLIVVRYFGGTKLGISGLIYAYKICAKQTLEHATIVEHTITQQIEVKLSFKDSNLFFDFLNANKLNYTKNIIETGIQFFLNLEAHQIETVEKKILEFS